MSLLDKCWEVSKVKWVCWRSLSEREELGSSFSQLCTKVQQHLWRDVQKSSHINDYVMLNLWDMLEGRKKRKKQKARVILLRKSWRKEIGWNKVKISWLVFIVTWYEECEREKRRKIWRNKGSGIRPFEGGGEDVKPREKERSPSKWDWGLKCSLVELHEWAQAKKKKRKIERGKENIQWGRE